MDHLRTIETLNHQRGPSSSSSHPLCVRLLFLGGKPRFMSEKSDKQTWASGM